MTTWYEKGNNKQLTKDRATKWRKDNPKAAAVIAQRYRDTRTEAHREQHRLYCKKWRADKKAERLRASQEIPATE